MLSPHQRKMTPKERRVGLTSWSNSKPRMSSRWGPNSRSKQSFWGILSGTFGDKYIWVTARCVKCKSKRDSENRLFSLSGDGFKIAPKMLNNSSHVVFCAVILFFSSALAISSLIVSYVCVSVCKCVWSFLFRSLGTQHIVSRAFFVLPAVQLLVVVYQYCFVVLFV